MPGSASTFAAISCKKSEFGRTTIVNPIPRVRTLDPNCILRVLGQRIAQRLLDVLEPLGESAMSGA